MLLRTGPVRVFCRAVSIVHYLKKMSTSQLAKKSKVSFVLEPFRDSDLSEFSRCMVESYTELLVEVEKRAPEFVPELKSRIDIMKSTELASTEGVMKKVGDTAKGGGFLLIARPEDAAPEDPVAGCVGAFPRNPFELELVRLFVDKTYRGFGLGKILVRKVLAYASEHGYERVFLMCGSTSGQALYKSVGFHKSKDYVFWMTVPNARKIQRVSILGGTHGNELIGIHLVNEVWKDEQHRDLKQAVQDRFKVDLHVCNPEAAKRCLRFVDRDLNRCFALEELTAPIPEESTKIETVRAQELNRIIGPKRAIPTSIYSWRKENPTASDYLIDMHSTTSNMGICCITLAGDTLTLRAALRIKNALAARPGMPPFNIVIDQFDRSAYNNIDSLPPSGLCIEVGPLAHGTLNNHSLIKGTHLAVLETLNEIREFNLRNNEKTVETEFGVEDTILDGFVLWKPLKFPKSSEDSSTVKAVIHPDLVGKDFVRELKKGDPVFVDFVSGDTVVTYEEDNPAYACFIGEAAYFTAGIAMWLCKKEKIAVYG